ncbi:MAG TPA: hypothetical protein VI279_03395 [Rhodocyclaceae bacterium]
MSKHGTGGFDLMDVGDSQLYFDEPAVAGVDALIAEAACHYGEPEAENKLLRAYFLAPSQLSVLVGMYRYYFYQHRLDDALIVAERALDVSARRLGLIGDWRDLGVHQIGEAVMRSMGLLRFHLLALKASAVVLLRMERIEEAKQRLAKLLELDALDRLGVAPLLEVVSQRIAESDPELAIAA